LHPSIGYLLIHVLSPFLATAIVPTGDQVRPPISYTPPYLAQKVLTSKAALEGERKQVTVLFADLKGSMELLADRDPEEARQLLDPVLERMMAGVHRYEGTVNQVLGDGIMALFGAPIAHEDRAVRACYAALTMQEAMRRYSEEVRRTHGIAVQMRVGLNSGEVVVRAIGNDLHMDYMGCLSSACSKVQGSYRTGLGRMRGRDRRRVRGGAKISASKSPCCTPAGVFRTARTRSRRDAASLPRPFSSTGVIYSPSCLRPSSPPLASDSRIWVSAWTLRRS
jgi:Adenylate and Guanylate cyclase catalytic domain